MAGIILRTDEHSEIRDILLGRISSRTLHLPKGFVRPNEAPAEALARVLATETGWRPRTSESIDEVVSEDYAFDPRETDHAWVECRASLHVYAFDEVAWYPLETETINRLATGQAPLVRAAIALLEKSERLEPGRAESLLVATG